jgi:hypothetical protein
MKKMLLSPKPPGRYNPDAFDLWSVHGHSRDASLWIGNWKKPDREEK